MRRAPAMSRRFLSLGCRSEEPLRPAGQGAFVHANCRAARAILYFDMNFYWVYDISNVTFCLLLVAVAIAFGVGGLVLTRGTVRKIFGPPPGCNDLVSYFLSATGVFYGITLGLIAIGAWENFNTVSGRVSSEASSVATLCQDVRAMGDHPDAKQLNDDLREYLRYTIEDAWPVQQRGIVPKGGTERLTSFQEHLLALETTDVTMEMMKVEMLSRLNQVIETRRLRLESVVAGLPGVLWMVVVVGGVLSMILTWCFVSERFGAHALLVGILGALVGLLIFMVAAMDNPFRGKLSVSPKPFELVLDRYYPESVKAK